MNKQKTTLPDAFTQQLWYKIESIYHRILAHPFNVELAAGTLSPDKFQYYVQQDELYIQSYARALAMLAVKSPTSDISENLLRYAKDGISIERALHDHYFKKFNIKPAREVQPACLAYTNFLLSSTVLEPFEVGIAALLPCFWIYRQVGFDIAQKADKSNPYYLWIETYIDQEYDSIVNRMIEITESVARAASVTIKAKMHRAFLYSTRLEWIFWDAAYRLEQWP